MLFQMISQRPTPPSSLEPGLLTGNEQSECTFSSLVDFCRQVFYSLGTQNLGDEKAMVIKCIFSHSWSLFYLRVLGSLHLHSED